MQLVSLLRNSRVAINKTDSADAYKSETSLKLSPPLKRQTAGRTLIERESLDNTQRGSTHWRGGYAWIYTYISTVNILIAFDVVCTVHHLTIHVCIQTNEMHKILVIRLYFPLDALHVSDCISPSSGATFISCTSHLVYAGTCRYHTSGCSVAIATQQADVWYWHIPNVMYNL